MIGRRKAIVSVAADGRVAILSSDDGVFGQFDVDGVWLDRNVPSADEFMEDFGPASPAIAEIFLASARRASAAARALRATGPAV